MCTGRVPPFGSLLAHGLATEGTITRQTAPSSLFVNVSQWRGLLGGDEGDACSIVRAPVGEGFGRPEGGELATKMALPRVKGAL
jgi:hypothetical protein